MKAFLDRYIAFGRSWFGPVLGVGFRVANHADLPACSEELRRVVYAVEGGTGVADRLVVCRKDGVDAYDWEDLF